MISSISSLLFSNYRRKVLELLLLNPDERYHVQALARLTGTVAGTLHKELSKLASAGVLVSTMVGNQKLYQANRECLIYDELESILRKLVKAEKKEKRGKRMDAVVEKNRTRILKLAKENGVRNVRVFGSMARNDANENSDLDLLVDLEKGKSGLALGGFLHDVSALIQRKVDVVTENSLHPRIKEKVLQEAIAL